MKLLIPLTALFLLSCSTSKIHRYYQEGVNIRQSTDDKIQVTLVKWTKNMMGYKHLFVTNAGDTLYQTYDTWLEINRCYHIPKPKIK